jgi:hypothetical protein
MQADVAAVHLIVADLLLELGQDKRARWKIQAALPVIEEKKIVPEGMAALTLLRQSLRNHRINRDPAEPGARIAGADLASDLRPRDATLPFRFRRRSLLPDRHLLSMTALRVRARLVGSARGSNRLGVSLSK